MLNFKLSVLLRHKSQILFHSHDTMNSNTVKPILNGTWASWKPFFSWNILQSRWSDIPMMHN